MTFNEAVAYLKKRSPLRITLTGDIGAGKSTFSTHFVEILDIPRIYIGQFMREEAKRRNITLDAFNALLEKDDRIDREMDAMQKERSKEIPRGIFEGRTSWYFVENPDVTVYLTVDPKVAAERIWQDQKENGLRDTYDSIEKITKANIQRKQSEITRYQNYYGIDVYDESHFDIVLDTSAINEEEVFSTLIIQIAEFLQKKDA